MTTIILVIVSLFMTGIAEAQISCAQYSNSFYCIGPNGNTSQTDLGNGMGVISDDRGNVTPYAILPPSRSSAPTFGIQPLPSLPTLPTLPSLPSLAPPSLAPPPVAEPFSSGPIFLGTPGGY